MVPGQLSLIVDRILRGVSKTVDFILKAIIIAVCAFLFYIGLPWALSKFGTNDDCPPSTMICQDNGDLGMPGTGPGESCACP